MATSTGGDIASLVAFILSKQHGGNYWREKIARHDGLHAVTLSEVHLNYISSHPLVALFAGSDIALGECCMSSALLFVSSSPG